MTLFLLVILILLLIGGVPAVRGGTLDLGSVLGVVLLVVLVLLLLGLIAPLWPAHRWGW